MSSWGWVGVYLDCWFFMIKLFTLKVSIYYIKCYHSNFIRKVKFIELRGKTKTEPMSYSSIGTSFSHNNGMEDDVMGSRLIGCVCNLPIKKGSKLKRFEVCFNKYDPSSGPCMVKLLIVFIIFDVLDDFVEPVYLLNTFICLVS